LLEGFNIHGTGNGTNNKIIGNSSDNIIDGVTGADEMMGIHRKDTDKNRLVFAFHKPSNKNQYLKAV